MLVFVPVLPLGILDTSIFLKRVCFAQPPSASFFKKGCAAVIQHPVIYVSRLVSPDRAVVPGHEKNHAPENRKRGLIGAILLTNRPSTLILWVKDGFSDEGSEVPVRFSSNEGLRVPAAQPSCERSFFHLCSELYHNFALQSSGLFFWSGQRPWRAGDGLVPVLSVRGGQTGLQAVVVYPYRAIGGRREPLAASDREKHKPPATALQICRGFWF